MRSAASGLNGHAASASASAAAMAAAATAAPAAPVMTTQALPPVLPASIVAACAPFAGAETAYYEEEMEQRWRLRSIYLPADSKGLVSVAIWLNALAAHARPAGSLITQASFLNAVLCCVCMSLLSVANVYPDSPLLQRAAMSALPLRAPVVAHWCACFSLVGLG